MSDGKGANSMAPGRMPLQRTHLAKVLMLLVTHSIAWTDMERATDAERRGNIRIVVAIILGTFAANLVFALATGGPSIPALIGLILVTLILLIAVKIKQKYPG